jgi:hypothetical protein
MPRNEAAAFQTLLAWDDDDDDDCAEQYDYSRRRAFAAFILGIAVIARQRRKQRRRDARAYLTRPSLPPVPRADSAWTYLYSARLDKSFIVTMGVDVATFHLILEQGFAGLWNSTPITRQDVRSHGAPRLQKRSLDAPGGLGFVLHYLNSTMSLFTLQQVFALVPSVSARYLIFGLKLLLRTLLDMPEAKIAWPSEDTMAQWSAMIRVRHPPVKHAIGFVDGVHLPLECHGEELVQNAYYNGWCASHFTSNIFAFGVDGTIMYCTVNAPGSWHDAIVAQDLYHRLLERTPEPYYIVSDTAFPSNDALATKIKKPLKQDFSNWPQDPLERAELFRFNRQLVSCRQAAEWGMRSLQGSFGRLRIPMPSDDARFRQLLLLVICRMHQVRTRLVGINQIKNVYERAWRESGLYDKFEQMVFGDIQRSDRIGKFYNLVL